MIVWAKIKHHDPKNMLAICGTCHDRCSKGQIDYKAQIMYKAKLFELVGVKDDLGALFMGLLISSYPKSREMAKSMLGFKDLFLVGFFLSIGMSGQLSLEVLTMGVLLVPFIFVKAAVFYTLMTRFKLRSRTSLLATLNLTNYSEFGLIVGAIGVANGWIMGEWLVVIAIALSISFVVADCSSTAAAMDEYARKVTGAYWVTLADETAVGSGHARDGLVQNGLACRQWVSDRSLRNSRRSGPRSVNRADTSSPGSA